MKLTYCIGLDLGQTHDYTALVVLEYPRQQRPVYAVRHLERSCLGTAYTDVVPAVARLAQLPQLGAPPVVVDQTALGRLLVDMPRRVRLPGRLVPVAITARSAVRANDHAHPFSAQSSRVRIVAQDPAVTLSGAILTVAAVVPFPLERSAARLAVEHRHEF